MTKLLITSLNMVAKLESNIPQVIEDIRLSSFMPQYIPALTLIPKINRRSHVKVVIRQHDTFRVSLRYPLCEIWGTYPRDFDQREIVALMGYLLERCRQERGVYTISGSAVGKRDRGLLIFGGASGLGKTSLAAKLCSEFGFFLLADERVLLAQVRSRGERPSAYILGGVGEPAFNKPASLYQIDKGLAEIGTAISKRTAPCKLLLAIQPLICKEGSLGVDRWDEDKADWHFYEELSRKIRGVSRRIHNLTYPLPPLDTLDISKRRAVFSWQVAQTVPFYSIAGDLTKVAHKVAEIEAEIL